jgi:hypothetical protein
MEIAVIPLRIEQRAEWPVTGKATMASNLLRFAAKGESGYETVWMDSCSSDAGVACLGR